MISKNILKHEQKTARPRVKTVERLRYILIQAFLVAIWKLLRKKTTESKLPSARQKYAALCATCYVIYVSSLVRKKAKKENLGFSFSEARFRWVPDRSTYELRCELLRELSIGYRCCKIYRS